MNPSEIDKELERLLFYVDANSLVRRINDIASKRTLNRVWALVENENSSHLPDRIPQIVPAWTSQASVKLYADEKLTVELDSPYADNTPDLATACAWVTNTTQTVLAKMVSTQRDLEREIRNYKQHLARTEKRLESHVADMARAYGPLQDYMSAIKSGDLDDIRVAYERIAEELEDINVVEWDD